jgi:hypothetical protein
MNDRSRAYFDPNELLHPERAFGHPSEVIKDRDLSINEKRAILASWASDACAMEAAPELRANRHGPPVRFDDIMEALRNLDKEVNGYRYRNAMFGRPFRRDRKTGQNGSGASLQ